MARAAHGYSGKPLFQKLGLKPGFSCLVVGAPDHFDDLVEGAEDVRFDPVETMPAASGTDYDVVHFFCANAAALDAADEALRRLKPGGMLWVSWPKKSSKLFLDLTEDGVRAAVLPTGWVDVKVCAVDADWSGLKFLRRKVPKA